MKFCVEDIAHICHEANLAYQIILGEETLGHWEDCPAWQKESGINGVIFALEHPGSPASTQHETWMREKIAAGWTYGEKKDPEAKTHPCLVDYEKLPVEQRIKDYLFRAIVAILGSKERYH